MAPVEGEGQRLMVSQNIEVPTLKKVTKVLNGNVNCQQLTCKTVVLLFSQLQFLGLEGKRLPARNVLLNIGMRAALDASLMSRRAASVMVWFSI